MRRFESTNSGGIRHQVTGTLVRIPADRYSTARFAFVPVRRLLNPTFKNLVPPWKKVAEEEVKKAA